MNLNLKNFLQSKTFRRVLHCIGILVVALLIFQAGEFIGYRKAKFSYRLGERFYHNAYGKYSRRSPSTVRMIEDLSEADGATGKIIEIDLPNIIVEGRDGVEKIILIKDYTVIRLRREVLKSTDLKVDDSIMVIGSPNNETEIEAKFIRLLPQNLYDTKN